MYFENLGKICKSLNELSYLLTKVLSNLSVHSLDNSTVFIVLVNLKSIGLNLQTVFKESTVNIDDDMKSLNSRQGIKLIFLWILIVLHYQAYQRYWITYNFSIKVTKKGTTAKMDPVNMLMMSTKTIVFLREVSHNGFSK